MTSDERDKLAIIDALREAELEALKEKDEDPTSPAFNIHDLIYDIFNVKLPKKEDSN